MHGREQSLGPEAITKLGMLQDNNNLLLDCLVWSLCKSILFQTIWGRKFPHNAMLSVEFDEFIRFVLCHFVNRLDA